MQSVLPWKQLVDQAVVVVVLPDAKQALDVALDGSPEQGSVDRLVSTNGSVSQVVYRLELGV